MSRTTTWREAGLASSHSPTVARPVDGGHERRPGDAPAGGSPDRPRRSRRDWVVDTVAFLLAVVLGVFSVEAEASRPDGVGAGTLVLDVVVGSLACLALWARRRRPVALAVAVAVATVFSAMAGGAGLILLFTVAVHRRWPSVAGVAVLTVVSGVGYFLLRPDPQAPLGATAIFSLVTVVAVVAWGMFIRARRQLVLSLRDRAVRAETEQQLRVEQARQAERARMAREMHDVLGHRLSLLSMHAGALEFRPDADPQAVAHAAGVIRQSAHLALEDLREVVAVLREGPDGSGGRPQPTLADLPALVEESRSAGVKVHADVRVPELSEVPSGTGRSAYRIVQEALTNARKHAPGARVDLVVEGTSDGGLSVEVRNPYRRGEDDEAAGRGTGLVGLSERATLAGGRLDCGPTGSGDFRVRAWLPWPR